MRIEETYLLSKFLAGLISVWLVLTTVILPQPPSLWDFLTMIGSCGVVLIIVMVERIPSATFFGAAIGTILSTTHFLTGKIAKLDAITAILFLAAGIVYPLYSNNRRR